MPHPTGRHRATPATTSGHGRGMSLYPSARCPGSTLAGDVWPWTGDRKLASGPVHRSRAGMDGPLTRIWGKSRLVPLARKGACNWPLARQPRGTGHGEPGVLATVGWVASPCRSPQADSRAKLTLGCYRLSASMQAEWPVLCSYAVQPNADPPTPSYAPRGSIAGVPHWTRGMTRPRELPFFGG